MSANLSAILYLISGVLFILALRGLSSPETSRQGNLFGIIGMIIAVTVTFLSIGNFSSGFVYVLMRFLNSLERINSKLGNELKTLMFILFNIGWSETQSYIKTYNKPYFFRC